MATISNLNHDGTTFESRQGVNVPYVAEFTVDFAKALASKGSALAANDIIETIALPVGTAVMAAGLQCMVVDDATTLTLDLGITGGDPDEWVAAFDQAAAAAFAYAPQLDTVPIWTGNLSAVDTIDILLKTLTGTLTVGKVRVWAILVDLNTSKKKSGIALTGS